MTTDVFYEELDKLYTANDINAVREYLIKSHNMARDNMDINILLASDNELIGCYRSLGDYDTSLKYADEALTILEKVGLKDTIHYATTLLNTATALRGKKAYEESLKKYEYALDIFKNELSPYDYRFASLYNNMSTVYENMGDYESAKENLVKAANIISADKESYVELATTFVNIGQICFVMSDDNVGDEYIEKAKKLFEDNNATSDYHYSGVLAAVALSYYRNKDYDNSILFYKKAMERVESIVGKNDYYYVLSDNLEQVESKKEDTKNERN